MSKYKPNDTFYNWIESKSVVVVGYFDDKVKAIGLNHLLSSWIYVKEDYGESFSEHYPHAADHFQVTVVEKDDPRLEQPGIILRLLEDFCYCPHLKVWSDGEVMSEKEVSEVIDVIKERIEQRISL